MTETEKALLDAALRVFSRYGVKRSSMADLCQEAGVSRQTLYNWFGSKDDILRSLIDRYTDTAIAEIEDKLDTVTDLGGKLDVIFERMAICGYDMVQAMPNAQDFIDGVNAVSAEAVEHSGCRFRALIAGVLAPHEAALARAGIGVAELSDFIHRAAKSATTTARDRAHLVTQLQTLRQLCTSAASQDAPDLSSTRKNEYGQQA